MKIFITGVYGSGKTFLAERIAEENKIPFINFDEHIDYQSLVDQFDWLMAIVPEDFVMDAIPFDKDFKWDKFMQYQERHDCRIICCYCPDRNVWAERIARKRSPISLRSRVFRRLRIIRTLITKAPIHAFKLTVRSCWRFVGFREPNNISSRFSDDYYSDYDQFIVERFPELLKMKNVEWFDSVRNEYTSFQEASKRLKTGTDGH